METNYVKVTRADIEYIPVSEFLKALEKNGYEHIRFNFVLTTKKPRFLGLFSQDKLGACAIGQAALNLNAYPYPLVEALDKYTAYSGSRIMNMNDSEGLPYKKIVKRAKEVLSAYNQKTIPIIKKKEGTSWTPVIDLGDENVNTLIWRGEL